MFRACLVTLYGDRSPSGGRSQACRLPLHTGNTSGKSTRPARLRHCAATTLSEQSAASACLAVQSTAHGAGMMTPRRLSTVPAPLLRSVILVTGVVGLLAASGPAGIQNTGAAPRKDISAPSLSTELELAGAPQPSSMLDDDLGQTDVAMAALSLAGAAADASIALNKPEPAVETASTNSPDVPPTEPAPVQVAMANPSDLEPGGAGKAGSYIEAVSSIEIVDECLVVEICVDRYLWALYQRTPKEDTIKELERRNVTVKRRGKMVTVARTFTKLVDEDFGWKDPKAAERAGQTRITSRTG